MVTKFATGDLLRDTPPAARFDLILCRNVVIYFTEPVRDRLHELMVGALRPGGYLMIGSSERVSSPRPSAWRAPTPSSTGRSDGHL